MKDVEYWDEQGHARVKLIDALEEERDRLKAALKRLIDDYPDFNYEEGCECCEIAREALKEPE